MHCFALMGLSYTSTCVNKNVMDIIDFGILYTERAIQSNYVLKKIPFK